MKYLFLVIAYLIGAIPFSYIFAKIFKGIDIREYGSKNPGATNSFRVLGPKIGLCVFSCDFLKGGLILLFIQNNPFGIPLFPPIFYGLFAMIGHCYSCFLRFNGGKGAATSLGITLFLDYRFFLLLLSIALFTFIISKTISITSCVTSLFAPLTYLVFRINILSEDITNHLIIEVLTLTLIITIIISRHNRNIERMIKGIEPKINLHKHLNNEKK